MFFALDKSRTRVFAADAKKGNSYVCPVCNSPVVLKSGMVNMAHFAHSANSECSDSWHYDMSEWHRQMQSFFPTENQEVVIQHDGKIHRADVLFGNIVIEMQHSPITTEEFNDRNLFFKALGYRTVWIFDMQDRFDSGAIQFLNEDTSTKFRWSHPMRIFESLVNPLFDYDKSFAIYFHLYNCDTDTTDIFRVVWTEERQNGIVDFSRFAISEEPINLNEISSAEDLLVPLNEKRAVSVRAAAKQLDKQAAKEGFSYCIKYIREKGKPQCAYTCARENRFGLKEFGESACRYCKCCAMQVSKEQNGIRKIAIYCCYPHSIREPDGGHPGYECGSAPEYEL